MVASAVAAINGDNAVIRRTITLRCQAGPDRPTVRWVAARSKERSAMKQQLRSFYGLLARSGIVATCVLGSSGTCFRHRRICDEFKPPYFMPE